MRYSIVAGCLLVPWTPGTRYAVLLYGLQDEWVLVAKAVIAEAEINTQIKIMTT